MVSWKKCKHHGHGHHKKHKQHRKHAMKFSNLLKHMEKELYKGKRNRMFTRRCLSESDLSNITSQNEDIQKHITGLLRAIYDRRYGAANRAASETIVEPGADEIEADNNNVHINSSRSELSDKVESDTSRASSSEEENFCTKRKRRNHHKKYRHTNNFKRWRKNRYYAVYADASTMTDPLELTRGDSNRAVTREDNDASLVNKATREYLESVQEPKSPDVQQVTDNLRKSTLE